VRLFIALNLPSQVREDLWAATARLREMELPVKWVRGDGVHLTLKFLGEVEDEREAELAAALTRAAGGARALSLALEGFGVFPDFRRPRVVWAGIAPEPALEILQHRVEQEFAPLGFPTEARAFRPHVTLGRATRDAKPRDFTGLDAALGRLDFAATALVGTVDLMQSTLQSGGAVYHVRHSERLP
jgi:2'-5' RNA ligase